MEEVKFEVEYKPGVPNKNKVVISEECFKSMSDQVSKAYEQGNPIKLTIAKSEDVSKEDFCTIKPEDIIGDVKEFTIDHTTVEIQNCSEKIADYLISNGYSLGYRMTCEIDIKGDLTKDVRVPNLICFDMIKNRA